MELLLSSKRVSLDSITVTIVSAGRPRTVIKYANEEREQPFGAMAEPGYYKTNGKNPHGLKPVSATENPAKARLTYIVPTGGQCVLTQLFCGRR